MKIYQTPFFIPWFYPDMLWRMPQGEKKLYLTFDDGPVYGPTEFVLETLKNFGARATFFCIGDNISKHPEVFQRVCREGHVIGNHTYNHLNGRKTSTTIYRENMVQCDQVIQHHRPSEAKTEQSSGRLFRPPYGRITRNQRKEITDHRIIMWDVLTWDFDRELASDEILKNSISATRDGSIIVFHDSLKAEKHLVYALPRFLAHFASAGFSFHGIQL